MIGCHPIPGKRCWAHFCGSYGLPNGLEPRTPLVVIEGEGFSSKLLDGQGGLSVLNRVQIDAGFSFYLDGEEFHESHPKCTVYLRHNIQKLEGILRVRLEDWGRDVYRFAYQEDLSQTGWYLERNRSVPGFGWIRNSREQWGGGWHAPKRRRLCSQT